MNQALVPLGLVHAPLLAELHRLCFDECWNEAAMAGLLAMPDAFGFLAAADNEAPSGFILCRAAGGEAEILTLMVVPSLRRQGWARRLLRTARDEAAKRGAKTMFLEVSANNTAAKILYEDNGFAQVGYRPRYYGDGADALVLRAILS